MLKWERHAKEAGIDVDGMSAGDRTRLSNALATAYREGYTQGWWARYNREEGEE